MKSKWYIAYYIFGWLFIVIGALIALFGILYAITDEGPEYGFSLGYVVGLICLVISALPLIPGIILVKAGKKKKKGN